MTREEEIKQQAEIYTGPFRKLPDCTDMHVFNAFVYGARWADRHPAQSPWISIEDDLPAKHTPVYAKNGDKGKVFFALRTDNIARPWYDIVGRCPTTITHWKSIPLK